MRHMKRYQKPVRVFAAFALIAALVLPLSGCQVIRVIRDVRDRQSDASSDDSGVSPGKPVEGDPNASQPAQPDQTQPADPGSAQAPAADVREIVSQTLGLNYIGGSIYAERFESRNENGNYRIEKQLITDGGWFGGLRMDFDGDGQDEILAAAFEGGAASNDIVLHMLEQSGDGWTASSSISTQLWNGNGSDAGLSGVSGQITPFRRDVFVQGAAGPNPVYIYVEDAGLEYHFADGMEWSLRRCTYNGSQFEVTPIGHFEDGTLGFGGSSDTEGYMYLDPNREAPEYRSYVETFVQNFRNTGLSAPQALGYSYPTIMANGGGCFGVCRFDRYESFESMDEHYMVTLGANVMLRDLTGGSDYGTVMHQFSDVMGNVSAGSAADMGYSIPDSSTRYLTRAELEVLSSEQLRYVRNEIYARHGRIFTSPDLREYFESQDWYHGTIQPEDFRDTMLNEIERANVRLITEIEDARS